MAIGLEFDTAHTKDVNKTALRRVDDCHRFLALLNGLAVLLRGKHLQTPRQSHDRYRLNAPKVRVLLYGPGLRRQQKAASHSRIQVNREKVRIDIRGITYGYFCDVLPRI